MDALYPKPEPSPTASVGRNQHRAEAVAYHRRGWCPIPVKERSKQTSLAQLAPYLSRKASREELSSWSWPGVGIVTGPVSGILVLDVDGPEGEDEVKKHGHPITPMVRTASGGLHLYFRHPEVEVRTGIRVAAGLDVKASGGYVVAPPSVGSNGKRYEWIISLNDAQPADPPDWLMQLLQRPKRNGADGPFGERIPPGNRNSTLMSLAGTMRRRGMGEAEIFAALEVTNRLRCKPPLPEEEVRRIVQSVSRYEPAAAPWWVKVVSKDV
jgi:Bifunctional DNA primase/polymerase, N-terminal/Primase C terminal 1 (PriCT-1)